MFAVGASEGPEIRNFAVARDERLAAGDLARIDVVALEVLGDAVQAPGVEAGPFGSDVHWKASGFVMPGIVPEFAAADSRASGDEFALS